MTVDEAKRLLAACAAFDNRQPSLAAARAWAKALEKIPLDQDAFDAVARYYATPAARPGERLWIQPADVIAHRRIVRSQRLENFVYEPPDPAEDGTRFLGSYRRQLDAVAAGRVAAPQDAPALSGGPHRTVAERLDGIGREIPDDDPIDAVRRAGPLGQHCPICQAPPGQACRISPLGRRRRYPHPVRVENAKRAALGLPPVDLEAQRAKEQAEVDRRREASRAALVRLQEREAAAADGGVS